MDAAHAIRNEVFVMGQNVPQEIEWDEFENTATHLICEFDGKIVGTGRISYFDNNTKAKVERVAVFEAYRNNGIGTEIVRFQIQEARKRKHLRNKIVLEGLIEELNSRYSNGFYIHGPKENRIKTNRKAKKKADYIYAHVQLHAKEFYAKQGFIEEGDIFLEADIEHIRMVYSEDKLEH